MGYINLTAQRRVPYMDSYVFGAAFYYGVMVLFTLYMFLFATPSIARVMPYKVVSYLFLMLDVWLMATLFKFTVTLRRNDFRSNWSLLVRLNEPLSLLLLLLLMIREKLLLIVSFKHQSVYHKHKLSPTQACFPQNTRLFLTNTPHKGIT